MPSPVLPLQQALSREDCAPLLVAFSGGLDSTALLHALSQDPQNRGAGLRAVHVHHGLQTQADDWAAHCREFCAALGIDLHIARVHVDPSGGEGMEAAARHARYAAFGQQLRAGEVLVTAHHREDQAETFLLRALRGSGPDGLAAMRPWRDFQQGRHWRPLLTVPRAALHAHARQHGLRWLEDPSNQDPQHDRNFLRLQLMPLLRQRWPHAEAVLARSAELSAEAADLLHQEDQRALAACRQEAADTLGVQALLRQPAARRARVLRRWIADLGLPPLPAAGIAHIESDLLHARADANAGFRWRNARILRWRDLLHAQVQRPPLPADWSVHWDGRQPLPLPNGGRLALEGTELFPAPVLAIARQGGERILLPGRAHSHSLKHVLQDLGLAPWQREQLPLLVDADGALLAVADRAYSAPFDAWLRGRGARLRWALGQTTPD